MNYTKTKKTIISLMIALIIVVMDQLTKYHIVLSMEPYSDEKKIISDLLVLRYIKNSGAAWGSFSSMTLVLIIVSIILIIGLGAYYFKIINDADKRIIRLLISFVIGGAIGNLIDRIRFGYVIDFIYVKAINFPVFNVADIFVTVSMFLIIFIILFSKDDEEEVKKSSKTETETETVDKTETETENVSVTESETDLTDTEEDDESEDKTEEESKEKSEEK